MNTNPSSRTIRWLAIVAVIGIATTISSTAHAQAPQIEPPWTGTLPDAGGIALLQTSRETSTTDLVARLRQDGCNVGTIAITEGGQWRMHVPSAPAVVNANFPATLPTATPFALRCAMPDVPVVLRTADDQSTLHLPVRGHLQVVLPANPSTGYAWRIEPELPTSVLAPLGEPIFRPASSAIGAGGTITLEFFANGPGLVQLHLVYDRTFESAPPLDEWTVTVIVAGQQTIAWLGEIRSQPAAPPTARYLELRVPALEEGAVPPGAGIVGSDGTTSNAIEAYTNTGTDVLVWGELTCGGVDYGNCRIDATSILAADADTTLEPYPIVGWLGTVGTLPDGTADYFQLAGHFPVQYGITGVDFDLEAQLTEVATNGTRIRIWGELHAPADDTNRTRIIVTQLAVAP